MARATVGIKTPEQLIAFLRSEAERRGDPERASPGQRGLINGRLALILDDHRLPFLKDVFGVTSSKELTRGQYFALRDWLVKFPPPTETDDPSLDQLVKAEAVHDLVAWQTQFLERLVLEP